MRAKVTWFKDRQVTVRKGNGSEITLSELVNKAKVTWSKDR